MGCPKMLHPQQTAELNVNMFHHGAGSSSKHITIVTLACRGALVNKNGLQIILLTFCILSIAAWGLIGPQVYAQWKAELVSGLHLHQLLHNTTPGFFTPLPCECPEY